ncbi:MAG: aldo/keto reductase [Candidatus Marinimicrobia bacterium]|nr:aldo/keto reductase [Candidatus Neomarinimicrobiota bacterium]
MENTILGRTGEKVSRISLGTWSYGGANTVGKKQPIGWAGQDDSDSHAALQKAYEVGINHWDTADVYGDGRSEEMIGSMWDIIPRKDIFIATKVGWDMGSHNHWYHPEQMQTNMERSLKNLRTDCVDLMYLHHCNFGKQNEYFDDAMETIRQFQAEGKTRFIGLSDWFSDKIMKFIDRCDPDVIQPYRNVMDDTYASTGLKNYVESNNLGICFFSPLKHGLLTGKYTEPATFESGDFRTTVKDFANQALIEKMQVNKAKLEARFSDHPQPVMHGLVDALLTDAPTGCVLLGQRNGVQVEAAAQLGSALSYEDAEWVKGLY